MGTGSTTGTTPQQMADWLQANGFKVSWGEGGSLGLIRENLVKIFLPWWNGATGAGIGLWPLVMIHVILMIHG